MLSVVIPAYNEENMIAKAAAKIREVLADAAISYELIFVDDGSKDRTWDEICAIHQQDQQVRGLSFSRNFCRTGSSRGRMLCCH